MTKLELAIKLLEEAIHTIEDLQHVTWCKSIRGPEGETWIEDDKCDCGKIAAILKITSVLEEIKQ